MPDKQQRETQLVYILFPMVGAFLFLVVVCCCGRKVKKIFHIPKIVATGAFGPQVRQRLRADLESDSDSDGERSHDEIEGMTFGGESRSRLVAGSRTHNRSGSRASSMVGINMLAEQTPLYVDNDSDWIDDNDLRTVYVDNEISPPTCRNHTDITDINPGDVSTSVSLGDIHTEQTGGSVSRGIEIVVKRESRVSESSNSEESDIISERSNIAIRQSGNSNTDLSLTESNVGQPVYKLHCTCSCPCEMVPKYMERIKREGGDNIEGSLHGSVCDINSQGVLLRTVFMKRDCCERHLCAEPPSRSNRSVEDISAEQVNSGHMDVGDSGQSTDDKLNNSTTHDELSAKCNEDSHGTQTTMILNPLTLSDLHKTRLNQPLLTDLDNNFSSQTCLSVEDAARDRHDSGIVGDSEKSTDSADKGFSSERSRYGSGGSCDSNNSTESCDSGLSLRLLSSDASSESVDNVIDGDGTSQIVTSV